MSLSSAASCAGLCRASRTLLFGMLTLTLAVPVAACSTGASSAHPAVKVCGQIVQPSGGGVEISPTWVGVGNDRSYGSPATSVDVIPEGPQGGTPTIVVIASGCSHGASYSVSPAGIVSAMVVATAGDHGAVALQLHGLHPGQTTLTVHSSGKIGTTKLNYG